jgi:hypothetical protein
MATQEIIHAIEPIGDGNGRVQITDIHPDDITVAVTQPFRPTDDRENRPKVTVWLDNEVIKSHVTIQKPPDEEQSYDAMLIISGAPVPEDCDSHEPLKIDITVDQVQQAKAAECPGCGADLRNTFGDNGCTECGFYPV